MRRTRKWSFVAQEAQRLAGLGLSPREIAKQIGVNKSTVTRWIAGGKLARTDVKPGASPANARRNESPAEWAEAVRREFSLDATDSQLVALAELALELARDRKAKATVRMSAAARYQAIVKQLRLVARSAPVDQPASTPPVASATSIKRPRVVRAPGDPRVKLTAVK